MRTIQKCLALLLVLATLFSFASCSLLGGSLFGPAETKESGRVEENTDRKPGETAYVITYDLGYDGREIKVTYYASDDDYTPEKPTRRGYKFLWWTVDGQEGHFSGVVQSGSSGDILFHAQWELETYTISYENVSGVDVSDYPTSYTVESADLAIPDPSLIGVFFNGWQIGDSQPVKGLTLKTGDYAEDLTLRAVWGTVQFSAVSTNGTPVTAVFGDDTIQIGTPVRVVAPVYVGNDRFDHWEINGKKVTTAAFCSFSIPSASTTVTAVYEPHTVLTYRQSEGGDLSVTGLIVGTPNVLLGAGITAGDFTAVDTGATVKASFLRALGPGEYRFYMARRTDEKIVSGAFFTVRVEGTATAAPDYSGLTDKDAVALRDSTITYGGGTYPRVASTDAEFARLVEYFTLVEGVSQYKAAGNDKTKTYTFDVWVCGGLNDRLQAEENILTAVTRTASFPMHPSLSMGYTKNAAGSKVTLKVKYEHGLNEVVSSQVRTDGTDRQGLLTASSRASDFNAFPIDALTATAPVRTLYELEVLPFGTKPEFAASAGDAKTVYDAARAVLRAIVDDRMDDYQKVTAIYAWLALNVTYDDVTFASNASDAAAYTVKGALIDRVAVCDGYASAFRLLCQIEGIRAEEVTGLNELGNKATGHAWNKVRIGGAVYGVDSTWARQKVDGTPVVTLQYLFMNEADLLLNEHFENADPNDPCVVTVADAHAVWQTANLYSGTGSYVISTDADYRRLVEHLKSAGIKTAEFIITGKSLPPFPGANPLDLTDPLHSVKGVYTTKDNYGYVVLK